MWPVWRTCMVQHGDGRRQGDMSIPILAGDMPWAARVALFVLFWLGPGLIVAAIFLAMWTGWISSPITENRSALIRIEAKLNSAIDSMQQEVIESQRNDEYVVRLLLVTCRNISRTEVDRQQCDLYWKRP